jgi:hypothetical protein
MVYRLNGFSPAAENLHYRMITRRAQFRTDSLTHIDGLLIQLAQRSWLGGSKKFSTRVRKHFVAFVS